MPKLEKTGWVQCGACDKWRTLPKGHVVSEESWWECEMHPNPSLRSCNAGQEAMHENELAGEELEQVLQLRQQQAERLGQQANAKKQKKQNRIRKEKRLADKRKAAASGVSKPPKFAWTATRHTRFEAALNELGDAAKPAAILKWMNADEHDVELTAEKIRKYKHAQTRTTTTRAAFEAAVGSGAAGGGASGAVEASLETLDGDDDGDDDDEAGLPTFLELCKQRRA